MTTIRIRQGFILAIIVICILMGYGIYRFSLLVREAGPMSLIATVLMLLLYGVVAITVTNRVTQASNVILKLGTGFGLAVGMIFIVDISVENFVDMSGQVSTISTLGFMLLIFLIFAYTGWYSTNKSHQLPFGVFASVWSAMVGVVIAVLIGLIINFLFTQRLEQSLQASAEYLRSGSQDLETFTFSNTLDSAFTHLLEAPIIAVVFGFAGSLISLGFRQLQKKFRGSPLDDY